MSFIALTNSQPNYSGAPANGSAWESGDCSKRTRRGGSLYLNPTAPNSATRNGGIPDYRGDDIGFRLGGVGLGFFWVSGQRPWSGFVGVCLRLMTPT